MLKIAQSLAMMVGMLPAGAEETNAKLSHVVGWLRGLAFAAAAIAALIAIIGGGVAVWQFLTPKIIGLMA